jgi:fumarylacetoacetase
MEERSPKRQRLQTSWIPYAPECNFPIQNLPYGIFRPTQSEDPRPGVAIGDQVLDLKVLHENGLFGKTTHLDSKAFTKAVLNDFMAQGRSAWKEARTILTHLLAVDTATLRDDEKLKKKALHPIDQVILELPAQIGDYTDFYSSKHHAYNVGVMFRGKDNALQPNWTWLPVGYHGRSSSVVISGTDLHRPKGQLDVEEGKKPPLHAPCRLLDFELEMAFFIGGPGNKLGQPISMKDAEEHIFGLVVMNDWSARDIQRWEYVPLGPFGAKNFGTTISPWIVTLEALEGFKISNQVQDPTPLPYLQEEKDKPLSTYNIELEVTLQGKEHKAPHTISRTNSKYLYWNFKQQLVHHTVTGCNMRAGDLLGSGTISGPSETEYGSLLELCWKGTKTIPFPDGSTRKFIQDGDEINMIGYAQGEGYRIGFGPCKGKILPALVDSLL